MTDKFSTHEDPYDPKHHVKYRTPDIGGHIEEPDSVRMAREQADAEHRSAEMAELRQSAFESGLKAVMNEQQRRIEALRAAAQIMANHPLSSPVYEQSGQTLDFAEQFATWLETGER